MTVEGLDGTARTIRLYIEIDPQGTDPAERLYLEAVLDLIRYGELPDSRLSRCHLCGTWFIPDPRRQDRARFCGPRCRNRYHYERRQGSSFLCFLCQRIRPIDYFSGLVLEGPGADGVDFRWGTLHEGPAVCTDCADARWGPAGRTARPTRPTGWLDLWRQGRRPAFLSGWRTVTPSPHHPLGAKGVGESATVGAPAAVVNAVVDALWHLGVRHIDIPITPYKVWQILRERGITE